MAAVAPSEEEDCGPCDREDCDGPDPPSTVFPRLGARAHATNRGGYPCPHDFRFMEAIANSVACDCVYSTKAPFEDGCKHILTG